MFIKKYTVEDHKLHKHELLDLIELHILENNLKPAKSGYKLDFMYDGPKPYLNKFYEIVTPFVDSYAKDFGCKFKNSKSAWFHQYTKGQKFGWHCHNRSIAIIYYVELPNPEDATEFFNINDLDIKEGEVIIFPAFVCHQSPEIQTNNRKTIISDNFEFSDDREYIKSVQ